MIKAVLFDLGGVLAINKKDHLGPRGSLQISSDTWHKAGLGLVDDEVAFAEMAKNHRVDAQTIKEWLFSKREPNNEVLEILSNLKPELKKAIISNSLKSIFNNFMDKFNLKDKFDILVISAEEQVKKPNKEIFLRACQRLGVNPSECLFIDNDQEHIEVAEKLGMTGILFINAGNLKQELSEYSAI